MARPALVVGFLAMTAIAGASPHAGKVVRVERSAGRPKGSPRLCAVSAGDASAYCFGKKPEVGDVMNVVDTQRVLATLRIETVTSTGLCAQAQGQFWTVSTKVESGAIDNGGDTQMFGLLDVAVDAHGAHWLKDEHAPPQRIGHVDTVIAIDTNGDNQPDIEFLQDKCDDSGNPTSGGASFCIEVWYASGRHFELMRTDRFQSSCY
jgi:hypothetical protein